MDGNGISFHQHSDYSWLDGCSSTDDICKRAKALGQEYVCLSDHGNCAGHIAMYDAAKKHGLKPILGTELYVKDDHYDNDKVKGYHLCVWALNDEGLRNVWSISSDTYYDTGDGHRTPNTKWEHLEGHGSGVACTSACIASALGYAAQADNEEMANYFASRYAEIFDEFYIEIHVNSMPEQRRVNMWLIDFAKRNGYKVLYAVDSHYANKDDADFHDVWLGCQIKSTYDQQHWKMDHEYYMQGEDEIKERLAYLGDDLQLILDGMDDFVSKVEEVHIDNSRKVPSFPLPEGWESSNDYLQYQMTLGLLSKVGKVKILPNEPGDPIGAIRYEGEPVVDLTPYITQLKEQELPLIIENDLADYFLIVSDYCRYAKQHMLVGWGRGSCVSSVLCYVLDITEVDPIKAGGLFFSRFLNGGRLKRGTLPDIDLDFPDFRKHMVHDYLKEKYGEDHVCAVGITTYFGIKLAIKEVCRYYKIPMKESNRMTSILGNLEELGGDWEQYLSVLPADDKAFIEKYRKEYPDLFDKASRMVGLARQPGKHAAGYVIAPESLAGTLPIRRSDGDEIISQFDKRVVERMGFLKADILGLRNLTTLMKAAEFVKERRGIEIDFYDFEESPDDELWELFHTGKTLGIFQMEGAGITRVAKILKPTTIKGIATVIAAYRPGLIYAKSEDGSSMLEEFLSRSQGKPFEYIIPELEPILSYTYGCIVFQEQALQILTEVAGFSDEDADIIRDAIGHKNFDKMQEMKPKYLANCEERGIPKNKAELIYSQIEAASDYSFNLSHALGYGTISYWTAYMKAHYTVEYLAACMSTTGSEKAAQFIKDAKKMGIEIVPPILSRLTADYAVLDDTHISFGISNVKGCGPKAIEKILANAPYTGFADFVDRSGANATVVKNFINIGVFRSEHPNRRDLYMRYLSNTYRPDASGNLPEADEEEPYTYDVIIDLENEIMGIALSANAFTVAEEKLSKVRGMISAYDDVVDADYETAHILAVKVDKVKEHQSKSGVMAFITLSTDTDDSIEVTAFSKVYDATRQWLYQGALAVVEVIKKEYQGDMSLQLSKVMPI